MMEKRISEYLQYLNIPVSKKYVERCIASHPDYPSVLSVVDGLEQLGIRYQVGRVDEKNIDHLPFPYVLFEDKGEDPKLIKRKRDLSLPHQAEKEQSYIVLQAEPTGTITNHENNKKRSEEKFFKASSAAWVVAVAGLILISAFPFSAWLNIVLIVTAVAGVGLGYLLIAKDIGVTYDAVEHFCTGGKQTDCDAILKSDGARLFGGVTLSDAAASYFLFQLIIVGFGGPSGMDAAWAILAVLSWVAMPVVLYSLYYQSVKAKTWCRLCIMVDVILVAQAALLWQGYNTDVLSLTSVTLTSLVETGLVLVAAASSVLLLRKIFRSINESRKAEIRATRFKNDTEVFLYVLKKQKPVDDRPFEREILIGNSSAPVNIIMAASLTCGPCKDGFEKATQLVSTYPGKVRVSIRLRPSPKITDNGTITPSSYLLAYWLKKMAGTADASDNIKKLLQTWYEVKELDKFKEQYEVRVNSEILNEVDELDAQYAEWMRGAKVQGTPSFFVGGYRLPKEYSIDDLMGLIPTLSERYKGELEGFVRLKSTNKEVT